ncbi:hypothetical protein ACIGKQ_06670 [Gordonia sp. NPDC062954]|uniref:hypothetical protein n=1 Tax=Gordonia sp. NPDC062954 TaxID=3364003 RepID=UPI0037C5C8DF
MVQRPACSAASPTAIAGMRLEPRATSITVRAAEVTRTPSTVVVAAGRVSVIRRTTPVEREPGDRDGSTITTRWVGRPQIGRPSTAAADTEASARPEVRDVRRRATAISR